MKWEYLDRMVIFQDADGGMVSGLDAWINDETERLIEPTEDLDPPNDLG